jgi:ribosomal protein S27E
MQCERCGTVMVDEELHIQWICNDCLPTALAEAASVQYQCLGCGAVIPTPSGLCDSCQPDSMIDEDTITVEEIQ